MNGTERKFLNKMHADWTHMIVQLEAKFEERWKAHEIRSKDLRECIDKKFDRIFEKLDGLRCEKQIEKTNWLVVSNRTLWGVIIILGLVRGYLLWFGR